MLSPLISGSILPFQGQEVTLGGADRPLASAYVRHLYNDHGLMKVNNVLGSDASSVSQQDGVDTVRLNHNATLQLTPEGKLSVVPKVLLQSDLDMRARAPVKVILDPDVH